MEKGRSIWGGALKGGSYGGGRTRCQLEKRSMSRRWLLVRGDIFRGGEMRSTPYKGAASKKKNFYC